MTATTDQKLMQITPTLETALGRRIGGDVRFDLGSRAAYAVDSSNYREVPIPSSRPPLQTMLR